MAGGIINLRTLTLEELTGVVNLYPWYGAARKELCARMTRQGGDAWGQAQYADAALYVADRAKIAALLRRRDDAQYSDKDAMRLVRALLREDDARRSEEAAVRPVRAAGGDYFTQAQYEGVRHGDDNVFSRFAAKAAPSPSEVAPETGPDLDFCTETLAQIYADQGYYEQARRIYSRLLLNFPEKNAYFAALIEKLGPNKDK